MRKFFKKYLYIFILAGLCFFAIRPLLAPGFFPMHDNEQVGRLYELHQVLLAGEIPPRIVPNLGFGYGYPFFNFYPPFVYYVAEAFHLLGCSYIVSIKLMIATGFFTAALAMFLFSRRYLSENAAIVAAIAYTYAPYHAVDVYVRGALPEFFTFVFIPLIFLGFSLLAETLKKKYVIINGIFIALLILTHNLIMLMSSIFLLIYTIYLLINTKNKVLFSIYIFLSGALGLAFSAYFWIPSFFEKKDTMIDLLTTDLANYSQHFVYFRQFWDSPWGYGGSIYGLFDGLSFQIGKIQIIAIFLGTVLLLSRIIKRNIMIFFLFLVFFALSVFLMTFHSKFIWDLLPPFWYIQFPWRFLVFAAFFGSFFVGVIQHVLNQRGKTAGIIGYVGMILLVLFLNVGYFVPAKYLTEVTDQSYTASDVLRWDTSKLAAEYTPKGIITKKTDINTSIVAIEKNQIAKQSYQVLSGNMTVLVTTDKPQVKSFELSVRTPGEFRINTFAFPGWKVYQNGQEIRYNDMNDFKLISFAVPAGHFHIKAVFTDTIYRSVGNKLTMVSIMLTVLYVGYYIFRKRYAK